MLTTNKSDDILMKEPLNFLYLFYLSFYNAHDVLFTDNN